MLRLPVGAPVVMFDQLHHLLRMSLRPCLTLLEFAEFKPVAYLDSETSSCVEVGWRTSSYSGTNGGCVEVAPTPDAVLIRDSKHRTGPTLTLPTPAWHTFLTTLPR